jgi:hypothetical protein
MDWRLTVATRATHQKLAALADLKAQLGITGTGDDTELGKVIARRSAVMAAYCRLAPDQNGARGFGRETLEVTYVASDRSRDADLLLPWRVPVVSVTSVVEDGIALAAADYRLHGSSALLERLSGDDPVSWSSRKIVVTCVAGWLCFDEGAPTVPEDVQAVCLEECKAAWLGRKRDPLLRSEELPDVYSAGYALQGATGGMEGQAGLMQSTVEVLAPYRSPMAF